MSKHIIKHKLMTNKLKAIFFFFYKNSPNFDLFSTLHQQDFNTIETTLNFDIDTTVQFNVDSTFICNYKNVDSTVLPDVETTLLKCPLGRLELCLQNREFQIQYIAYNSIFVFQILTKH